MLGLILFFIGLLATVIFYYIYDNHLTIGYPTSNNPRFVIVEYSNRLYLKYTDGVFWKYLSLNGYGRHAFYTEKDIEEWLKHYIKDQLAKEPEPVFIGKRPLEYEVITKEVE